MPTAHQTVNTSPDSVLIARFQSGDVGVFDLLYHRHRDRVHGVILYVFSNPDDALDLTQEVFLKAYQRLDSFKRLSQFYSWLYRIAINRCIDRMRRQSKHSVVIDAPFLRGNLPRKTRPTHRCP
jgi:RNA polymerase sigma-70 factor (ECF subfamily)